MRRRGSPRRNGISLAPENRASARTVTCVTFVRPDSVTTEFRTVVKHWDGVSWTQQNTRDIESAPAKNFIWGMGGTATDEKLFAVTQLRNGRAWAVGLYQQKDDSLIQTRRDRPVVE